MKILLANKFYYRRAGAEIYMINLEEYLKSKGHDVAIFSMQHPKGLETPFSKFFPSAVEFGKINLKQFRLLVTRPFGTREVKRKFNALLDEFQPDVVALSALLTTTMAAQGEAIKALEAAGIRDKVKVIVGGAPITEAFAKEIGADGYSEDASGAADTAKSFVN